MIFEITLERMIVFFLILAVGFVAAKLNVIGRDYLPSMAKLITKVLLPVMIFYSTCVGCTRQALFDNLAMVVLAALFYALVSLVLFLLARVLRLPHDKDRVFQFCFIFGNTGFVGIPLLAAVFPEAGLLYMMLFSLIDQAVFWTYGVWLATARDRQVARFSPRSLVTPNTVAIAAALVFVLADIPLPRLAALTLGTINNATSALCMMYLGALVCFSNVGAVLRRPELYAGVAVKMVALPVLAGRLLALTPLPGDLVSALVIIMALPVMKVVPMVAAQNGDEGEYATGITAATLVASVVTIPLAVLLA